MLNLTALSQSPVLDAIAAAAGVPRANVHINGLFTGRRKREQTKGVLSHRVFITVSGSERLDTGTAYSLMGNMDVNISWENRHTLRVAESLPETEGISSLK